MLMLLLMMMVMMMMMCSGQTYGVIRWEKISLGFPSTIFVKPQSQMQYSSFCIDLISGSYSVMQGVANTSAGLGSFPQAIRFTVSAGRERPEAGWFISGAKCSHPLSSL